ncbi:MAG: hypothetical protein LBQ88_21140 [Treponema sp.]|jgi:hypothetical protein|nr:hypothetical protein [Treponema sp.]
MNMQKFTKVPQAPGGFFKNIMTAAFPKLQFWESCPQGTQRRNTLKILRLPAASSTRQAVLGILPAML